MMKKLLPILLLMLLAALFVGSMEIKKVKAEEELFEYCNTGDNEYHKMYGTEWYGQTFTPSLPHNITYVKLKMFRGGSPGNLTVSIRSTSAGKPTGSDLTNGTTNANDFTTDFYGEWYQINLTEYTLMVDTQYAIVCRALDGNSSNYVRWRLDVTGTYDEGTHTSSIDNGTTWQLPFPNYDFMFEEWGEIQEYPYNYVVHGPYFENGTVADNLVNLTLQIENEPSENYILNGTDGIADTLQIYLVNPGVAFTWNFTGFQNYTRIYCLTSDSYEEIWIFVPDGNVYLYTFEVNNLAGVTNAYVETVINVGGQNRIVERQSIEVVYLIPFYMIFGDHYTLRLTSDEGAFTWGDFIPLSTTTITLTVRGVDFPKATLYKFKYVRIYAVRQYGNVTVVYEDLLNMTNSVTIYIKYLNGTNAYNATETADAFVHQWLNGVNSTDYYADVTIDHNRYGTYPWKQFLTRSRTVNPFDFTWLGTPSFDASPLIGIFIVVLTACAFSVLNPQIGAFAACTVATFLALMGWLPIPTPLLIGAWCFTFLFALAMSKVRVRT